MTEEPGVIKIVKQQIRFRMGRIFVNISLDFLVGVLHLPFYCPSIFLFNSTVFAASFYKILGESRTMHTIKGQLLFFSLKSLNT